MDGMGTNTTPRVFHPNRHLKGLDRSRPTLKNPKSLAWGLAGSAGWMIGGGFGFCLGGGANGWMSGWISQDYFLWYCWWFRNPALCGIYFKKTRKILKIMGLINYLSSECRISSSISTLWSTPSPRMQSSPPGLWNRIVQVSGTHLCFHWAQLVFSPRSTASSFNPQRDHDQWLATFRKICSIFNKSI